MNVQYVAKSRSGAQSSGLLDVGTLAEARRQLIEKGLFPVALNEMLSSASSAAPMPLFRRTKITKADLMMATCQLAVMTRAGIDLAEALRNVATHCTNPALKKVLSTILDDVTSGQSFSTALQRQVEVFGEAYVSSMAAAEASGTVANSLNRLTELLRNEIRIWSSVRSAMAYPIALIGVAGLVITAMFAFVLPQFEGVFRDLGAPPPPATRMLLGISGFVRTHWILIVAGAVGVGLAVNQLLRLPQTLRIWHRFQLNNPLMRRATRPLLAGKAFRLMATMLQTGVPLMDVIRLCRRSSRNVEYQDLFKRLGQEVESGRGMSTTLESVSFLPGGAAQMIRTAESTGRLGEVLETVGSFYEEEGERELRQVVKLLEPAIVVVMGVLVSLVVAAVILPLLDVSSVSG
jgi:type II secretory pathway component PulF